MAAVLSPSTADFRGVVLEFAFYYSIFDILLNVMLSLNEQPIMNVFGVFIMYPIDRKSIDKICFMLINYLAKHMTIIVSLFCTEFICHAFCYTLINRSPI
jgi:hypothetical protein